MQYRVNNLQKGSDISVCLVGLVCHAAAFAKAAQRGDVTTLLKARCIIYLVTSTPAVALLVLFTKDDAELSNYILLNILQVGNGLCTSAASAELCYMLPARTAPLQGVASQLLGIASIAQKLTSFTLASSHGRGRAQQPLLPTPPRRRADTTAIAGGEGPIYVDMGPSGGAAVGYDVPSAGSTESGISHCYSMSPDSDTKTGQSDTSTLPRRRKGHLKSRQGSCYRLAIPCTYASKDTCAEEYAETTNFSLEDFRFYEQFSTTTTGDPRWMECVAMVPEHPFLAHAVLGLGATHISCGTSGDFKLQALSHRNAAIKLLTAQSSKLPSDYKSLCAILAAFLCLTAQSALFDADPVEYMTLSRSGYFIAITGGISKSTFPGFTPAAHDKIPDELLQKHESADISDIKDFNRSLESLEPLLQTDYEKSYYALLSKIHPAIHISSSEGKQRICV
ncbi:hypothetical protein G3M48_008887 [Beauveria asiatica]|uniref:Uncharacterized protein n=1 Tax=Beauveria asiatica TaxID=1069075 RepID=A0AAW0RK51_9HYPO